MAPGNLESLKQAFYSISKIVDDLEELKSADEVVQLSAGDQPLLQDVNSLLMQTLTLKKHIVIAIAQHPELKNDSSLNSAAPAAPKPAVRNQLYLDTYTYSIFK